MAVILIWVGSKQSRHTTKNRAALQRGDREASVEGAEWLENVENEDGEPRAHRLSDQATVSAASLSLFSPMGGGSPGDPSGTRMFIRQLRQ
ncbi:MAG: hypothetical protein CMJ49_13535 [Planctomycetaceae bacterium]|nr:hypothetical protein [Planctomycetaceae bacterium]